MRLARVSFLLLLALFVATCSHREPVTSDPGPANVRTPAGIRPPAATPAAPAAPIPAEPVPPVVKGPAPARPLDLNTLETQLRETKAIGLTKVTLKDLRRSYDLLRT